MPLGLLYVATMLEEAGFYARVYDADSVFSRGKLRYTNTNRALNQEDYVRNLDNPKHPAWLELEAVLRRINPDHVGVSMMTPLYSAIRKTLSIIRTVIPHATILAGGPHITVLREQALACLPDIDVAFVGEAEDSIVEYARSMSGNRDLSSIQGLLFKKDGAVVITGERERIADLDALPIPRRDLLLNVSRYKSETLGLMIASRGCPFQCAFCASLPLWKRKVRLRSPESIFAELISLVESYRVKTFGFWDDTFTINKHAVIEFCRLIFKRYGSRKFSWSCLSNVNQLDDRMLRWLKKAGCRQIAIGVESGSDRILTLIKKGITTEKVRQAAALVKKHGLWLHTFFMIGFPQETEEDINRTSRFIREIKPDSINLCTFTPHPGTELYDYVIHKGLFQGHADFSIYDRISHHSMENFFVETISRETYHLLLQRLLRLTTKMSDRLTFRKLWLKSGQITVDKLLSKAKNILNR